jgi:cobalt-zinc-cadmium efflux system membrane fusion protein
VIRVLVAVALLAAACGDEEAEEHAHEQGAVADGMCVEHGVPEALCTKCNPALIPVFEARGDWCGEHGFPESICPTCNPGAAERAIPQAGAPVQPVVEARTVRFRSPEIEQAAGIETTRAERAEGAASIECPARIAFNQDRVADVRAIVPGIVRRVRVELGEQVAERAPLFDLESTRVGEIQGAHATARERVRTAAANLARQRELLAGEIASQRQVELAEQEVATARAEERSASATLRMAGAGGAAASGRYTLRSPIAGTVVRRPGVVGVLATESTSLATIADTSVMWALCDVAEGDAARIAVGQRVVVTVDGAEDATFEGEITWIAAEVDLRTRTITARAEIPNPNGALRANQFARARIQTDASHTSVSVPRDAVQRVEGQHVVFVRTEPGVYEPRVVTLHGEGGVVHVEGNVREGDAVVTTGAVLLRTEVMPGSIGAGCCEVEPPGSG